MFLNGSLDPSNIVKMNENDSFRIINFIHVHIYTTPTADSNLYFKKLYSK